MKLNDALTAYVGAFVDELANAGLKHVVVSPGSRSTPLAMTIAEHPRLQIWMNVDERSAAFFGLGIAKASHEPVALLCTSGTAAANYLPAIVEAELSRIPLVVITADRPHELRDVGAPQTINQLNMYANYVKWFAEMAVPESSSHMLKYARTMAGRAVATAVKGPAGPVHLNIPLREPLIPDVSPEMFQHEKRPKAASYVEVNHGVFHSDFSHIATELSKVKKGLIVCGPMHAEYRKSIEELANTLGFPIAADPLSQLRTGPHSKEWIMDAYDAFLRNEKVVSELTPEIIIRFGAMPVSKSLMLAMKSYKDAKYIVVDEDGGWRDPILMATDMIHADPNAFCKAVIESLPVQSEKDEAWGEKWKKMNQTSKAILNSYTEQESFFEGQIIKEIAKLLPDKSALFTGNSMPVRDIDTFLHNNERSIRVMGNRGANGIDGITSTALGASTVLTPLVLVVGDLSFFHDMNGLLAAKLYQLNITIVVINNNGGGIFSFLPQSSHPTHFETLFGTPTDLDFEHGVEMYGGSFSRVQSWDAFRTELSESLNTAGMRVIEVPTVRETNVQMHREMWTEVSKTMDELL